MLELVGSGEKRGSVNPFGGGIDWLEVRLPELSTFRPQVQEVIEESVMKSAYPSSLHYAAVIDLRKTGIADAILHLRKKRGPEHSHKLQLTQAAQFSFGQHVAEIENIVDCNPVKLEMMRTDLTVDLPNVPVQWVADHASIAGKQFAHYYDEDRPTVTRRMGKGEVQTFYCGKRPNCYRVYDKTAERWEAYKSFTRWWFPPEPNFDRWKKQVLNKTGQTYVDFETACFLRGRHPSLELARMREAIDSCFGVFMDLHDAWKAKCADLPPKPTFDEFCGLSREQVITRFERQIGAQEIKGVYRPGDARKIPIFSTLEELRTNAADWNPYVAVDFAPDGTVPDIPFDSPLPSMMNYSITEYMAGLHYRDRVSAQGRQLADAWVRRNSKGHGKEILARLEKFAPLATDSRVVRFTRGELYERYRAAIVKQIAA